jgi:transcriptional regulator with XRE-family HTH domain
MNIQELYGAAIRLIRQHRGIAQDRMDPVAARSYMSKLERGQVNVGISKVHRLCEALDVPPLTVHVLAYAHSEEEIDQAVAVAAREAKRILSEQNKL